MNRRTAIRNVVIITAGASVLPACNTSDETPLLTLKNIPLTGPQEKMMADLVGTIIPKTSNFIGATDLKSHEFALIMIDDCSAPEDQKLFTEGMKSFEDGCQKKFNTSFAKCTSQQKNDWLKELEASKDEKDLTAGKAAQFYKTIKRYTIQSFTSSQQYLQDIVKWKMVPGPVFKGCVAV
jgi:Gluconate 2-dehydrogenase subunit 3